MRPQETADLMLTKAKAYQAAFHQSARICRTRPDWTPEKLAEYFDNKARLEADLIRQLEADPLGFLKREGIIY